MTILKAGDKAPSFSAKNQNGEMVKLSDYKDKKVVLFFFPKASTPGCTAEACNLQNNIEKFSAQNYQIIGVSADSEEKQLKFAEKYGLNYPLLADVDKKIIKDYGVWGLKKFMGKEYEGIHRTTFVIDEKGIIEQVVSKVKTKEHADQILK